MVCPEEGRGAEVLTDEAQCPDRWSVVRCVQLALMPELTILAYMPSGSHLELQRSSTQRPTKPPRSNTQDLGRGEREEIPLGGVAVGAYRFSVTTRGVTLDGSTHLGVLSVRRIFLVAGGVSSTVLSSGYAAALPSRHWIVVSRRTSHSHTLPTTGIRHRKASLRDSSVCAKVLWGGQHRRDGLPPLPPTSPFFWS